MLIFATFLFIIFSNLSKEISINYQNLLKRYKLMKGKVSVKDNLITKRLIEYSKESNYLLNDCFLVKNIKNS